MDIRPAVTLHTRNKKYKTRCTRCGAEKASSPPSRITRPEKSAPGILQIAAALLSAGVVSYIVDRPHARAREEDSEREEFLGKRKTECRAHLSMAMERALGASAIFLWSGTKNRETGSFCVLYICVGRGDSVGYCCALAGALIGSFIKKSQEVAG